MLDVVGWFSLPGVFDKLFKSDLRLPEALYETLSICLLLAIGLKGGIEMSKQSLLALAPQVGARLALGFPFPSRWCRYCGVSGSTSSTATPWLPTRLSPSGDL